MRKRHGVGSIVVAGELSRRLPQCFAPPRLVLPLPWVPMLCSCRWFAPPLLSPDFGQALWALWPMGGAWLSTHLWEHYTYTLDKEFLKNKAYPLLEGCTLFLLDWLIEGHNGLLETNPSPSPEQMFIAPEHMFLAPDKRFASVSYSTTMDISIIKEVFSSIVFVAEVKLIFCSNLYLLSIILV